MCISCRYFCGIIFAHCLHPHLCFLRGQAVYRFFSVATYAVPCVHNLESELLNNYAQALFTGRMLVGRHAFFEVNSLLVEYVDLDTGIVLYLGLVKKAPMEDNLMFGCIESCLQRYAVHNISLQPLMSELRDIRQEYFIARKRSPTVVPPITEKVYDDIIALAMKVRRNYFAVLFDHYARSLSLSLSLFHTHIRTHTHTHTLTHTHTHTNGCRLYALHQLL